MTVRYYQQAVSYTPLDPHTWVIKQGGTFSLSLALYQYIFEYISGKVKYVVYNLRGRYRNV